MDKLSIKDILVFDSGYTRAPRRAYRYRWWKPIVATLLFIIFYFIIFAVLILSFSGFSVEGIQNIANQVTGDYDTMDVTSVSGIVLNFGGVAVMLPALFLAVKCTRMPFGIISSVYGRIRWNIILKCTLPVLIIYGITGLCIPELADFSKFTAISIPVILVILIVTPLQCAAEEYVFRGFLMQTFGSWIPFAIIPVIIQTVFFVSQHPYNIEGQVSIGIVALIFGWLVIRTGGIEVPIVLHTVNNLLAFFASATGIQEITSEIDWASALIPEFFEILTAVGIVWYGTKKGWFDRDDMKKVSGCQIISARDEARMAEREAREAARIVEFPIDLSE